MRVGVVTDWATVPVVMDIPYAARILAITPAHMRKLARVGNFPAHKCGGGWRIDREELREYIRTGTWTKQPKGEDNYG